MLCLYYRVTTDAPRSLPPMASAGSSCLISLFRSTHEPDQPRTLTRRLGIRDPTTPISRSCCCPAHLSHHPPLTQLCLNTWGHALNSNSPALPVHPAQRPFSSNSLGHLCSVCVCAYQGACHRCIYVTVMADLPQPLRYVYMKVHVHQNVLCFCETKCLCDCLTLKDCTVLID